MTNPGALKPEPSCWPHRLAVLLCCATFPLVWIGGLVTTYGAGMAVPDWPTTYGYNPLLYPIDTWLHGPWNLFVEHGHRLYASLVGLFTIAFCLSVWKTAQPKWLLVLGGFALAAVIFQGVLGGMRVLLDERTLAMIHGCFGPAFFAFTAVLAIVTSRGWQIRRRSIKLYSAWQMRLLVVGLPTLAYLQIVLGAQVRHFSSSGAPTVYRGFVWFHIVTGIALSAYVMAAAIALFKTARHVRTLIIPASLLIGLVLAQLTLGAATWIYKYNVPAIVAETGVAADFTVQAMSWQQAQITTAHVATGSLILAISTVLAVNATWMLNLQLASQAKLVRSSVACQPLVNRESFAEAIG